jgi:SAM-dependent methyltransferase
MNDNIDFSKYIGSLKPCIVCGGSNFTLFAKEGCMEARKCDDCSMISTNPYLTEEGVKIFYDSYFDCRINSEEDLFELRKSQYINDRNFLLNFIDSGRILDIGSSGGHFLSNFDANLWEREGIDLTKNSADFAKQNFDIKVHTGDVLNYKFDKKFDVISMRGVIEHFVNPGELLKHLSSLLNPGGFFYITATPDGDSFAFEVYREKWKLFTPLEHVHFFTEKSLTALLGNDFELIIQTHPYIDTPYADKEADYRQIMDDIVTKESGGRLEHFSPPFIGSMITALWKYNP